MELIQDFGPSDPPGQAQTFGLTGAGSLNGGAKKRGRGSGGPKTLFANKINASQSPSSARPSPRPAAPAAKIPKKAARRRGPGEARARDADCESQEAVLGLLDTLEEIDVARADDVDGGRPRRGRCPSRSRARASTARLGSEVHALSSHFFTKLQEEGLRAPDGKDRAYDRVERWTRGVDAFSKFPSSPSSEHLHWSLAIVCHPGALVRVVRDRIAREEEEAEERARRGRRREQRRASTRPLSRRRAAAAPCIIFMDSLKMHSAPKVERFLRAFLELEWAKRKPDEPELKLKLKVDLPLVVPKVPMQTNSCDCGVYVLRYAEEFLSRRRRGADRRRHRGRRRRQVGPRLRVVVHGRRGRAMRGDLKAAAEDLAVAASASA
ncbi:hypothetical protein JL722_4071 [Aureococcus anophagefferens]|nr:hypothetical protein JL722_4071 [Aureococcus anophagefferens]